MLYGAGMSVVHAGSNYDQSSPSPSQENSSCSSCPLSLITLYHKAFWLLSIVQDVYDYFYYIYYPITKNKIRNYSIKYGKK